MLSKQYGACQRNLIIGRKPSIRRLCVLLFPFLIYLKIGGPPHYSILLLKPAFPRFSYSTIDYLPQCVIENTSYLRERRWFRPSRYGSGTARSSLTPFR
uniref:Uncharacterized protein n=1 Tax=Picea glauca TaxID=3330 RepID=A0A101LUX0_PICGL|nr:hypothetical protein ABT39_MTgene2377 [Picea glauca]